MDYPRDNVFTFLFSTYRRTAGVIVAAILIVAIPVSLYLINQNQDIRQRASGNRLPTGVFDAAVDSNCSVNGWAYDPDEPTKSITVHIYKDGEPGKFVGATTANETRDDVNTAATITGKHGFNFVFDQASGIHDGESHKIFIYAIDSQDPNQHFQLVNSPKTITCPATINAQIPTNTPAVTPILCEGPNNLCPTGYSCKYIGTGNPAGQAYDQATCVPDQPTNNSCTCDGISLRATSGGPAQVIAESKTNGQGATNSESFSLVEFDNGNSLSGKVILSSEQIPAVRNELYKYRAVWNFNMPKLDPNKRYAIMTGKMSCSSITPPTDAPIQTSSVPNTPQSDIQIYQKSCDIVRFAAKDANLTPSRFSLFDLNDDGKLDKTDINILYYGFSHRQGD